MTVYIPLEYWTCIYEQQPVWDGSYLGHIDKYVGASALGYPFNFVEIKFEQTYWVAYHQTDTKYPCLVDELAPIFGVRKLGTHTVHWDNKLYVIYRTGSPEVVNLKGYVVPRYNFHFRDMVQDVIVFRLLMGLGNNFETSIIVINDRPASYRNRGDFKLVPGVELSRHVMEKWFSDIGIIESIRRMIDHNAGGMVALRSKIQETIKRVEPDLIWMDNQIITLINRLI